MLNPPRFHTLEQWLRWQEQLHPASIDLGLVRVGVVADRLGCRAPAPVVITVGGTNGKGSSVAMLDAILRKAGYRVGCYTSPHLFRYNERLKLQGEAVADKGWCEAFARVDQARASETLTYFEFGTLAALDIMQRSSLDVAILEVGLGGRLDAVNIVDADAALVTTVDIDHTDWLGNNREDIAMEKAGIFRPGRAAICGDSQPPSSLRAEADRIGANWFALGDAFRILEAGRLWHWQGVGRHYTDLPAPALAGAHQLANAAAVLMVLESLQAELPVSEQAIKTGLRRVELPGRIQRLPGKVEQVLDVSHNTQAATALVDALRKFRVPGSTWAVIGMMRDKPLQEFVAVLKDVVQHWCPVGLEVERACSCEDMMRGIEAVCGAASMLACAAMPAVRAQLRQHVQNGDRILVCGSFYSVSEWVALNN